MTAINNEEKHRSRKGIILACLLPVCVTVSQDDPEREGSRLFNEAINRVQEGAFDEADQLFLKATGILRSIPAKKDSGIARANRAIAEGRLDEAQSILKDELDDPANGARTRLILGQAWKEKGGIDKALALLDPLLVEKPPFSGASDEATSSRIAAVQLLFDTLTTRPGVALVSKWYGNLEPREANLRWPRFLGAKAKYASGSVSDAIEMMRGLASEFPDDPNYFNELMDWIAETEGADAALVLAKERYESRPTDLQSAFAYLSKLDRVNEDRDEAMRVLLELSKLPETRDNPTVLTNLGDTATRLKQWEEAIRAYKRLRTVTKDDPDLSALADFNLGRALAMRGDKEDQAEAIACLNRTRQHNLQSGDDQAAVYFYLGLANHRLEQWQSAEFHFRDYDRRVSTYDEETCLLLGEIYMIRKSWNDAADIFEKGLRHNEESAGLMTGLAEAQLEAGNAEGALSRAREARDLWSASETTNEDESQEGLRRVRHVEARALQKQNRFDEALLVWRSLLEALPDDPEARYGYADTLLLSGRHDETLAFLDQQSAPAPELDLLRSRALSRLGRTEEASILLDQLKQDPSHGAEAYAAQAEIDLATTRELLQAEGSLELAATHARKARNGFEEALVLRPGDRQMNEALTEVKLTETRIDERRRNLEEKGLSQSGFMTGALFVGIPALLALAAGIVVVRRRSEQDWTREAFGLIEVIEHGLRDLLETVAKPIEIDRAIEAGANPRTQQDRDELWKTAILSKLPGHRAGFIRRQCAEEQDRPLVQFLTFGDVISLVESYADPLGSRLAQGEARRLFFAELAFVKECRNTIFHMKKMDQPIREKFFRTVKPIEARIREALENLKAPLAV